MGNQEFLSSLTKGLRNLVLDPDKKFAMFVQKEWKKEDLKTLEAKLTDVKSRTITLLTPILLRSKITDASILADPSKFESILAKVKTNSLERKRLRELIGQIITIRKQIKLLGGKSTIV